MATTTNGTGTGSELITVKKALRELDIQPSTFYVACKRHEWLREAISEQFNDDIERNVKYITRVAVERYARERRATGSDHGGAKKMALWLMEDEIEKAEKALAKVLGREVTIDRMYKTKSKAEETEETEEVEA
jgi:hypothetical protein